MVGRRRSVVIVAALAAIAGCTAQSDDADRAVAVPGVADQPAPGEGEAADGELTTLPEEPPPATTAAPATTAPPTTVPETTSTSTTSTSTTSTTTTTTTTVPELDVYDPLCVMRIEPGDSLGLIADRFDDPTVTAASLSTENGIADSDAINAGALLDVCVDNGLDDITGEQRVESIEDVANALRADTVKAQQVKLNELFAGLGIRELLVDGVSGPVTRQRLCAARASLGLPVSRADMLAGTDEEQALMAATALAPPASNALQSDRWVLIDRTCQVMFAGESAEAITYVFPTSTGEDGYRTRDQDRSPAFRYDPALDNAGWHNSTTFPVEIDNPLNGNMYRPIYFDGGRAIHGANNVPTSPQSKGCARLRVGDQDTLVAWLGLTDLTAPTWSPDRINLRVSVQGAYALG
ncbi:MAG: L,D-transpeptidase family protein [Ilumatobacteraceae bacterium]